MIAVWTMNQELGLAFAPPREKEKRGRSKDKTKQTKTQQPSRTKGLGDGHRLEDGNERHDEEGRAQVLDDFGEGDVGRAEGGRLELGQTRRDVARDGDVVLPRTGLRLLHQHGHDHRPDEQHEGVAGRAEQPEEAVGQTSAARRRCLVADADPPHLLPRPTTFHQQRPTGAAPASDVRATRSARRWK